MDTSSWTQFSLPRHLQVGVSVPANFIQNSLTSLLTTRCSNSVTGSVGRDLLSLMRAMDLLRRKTRADDPKLVPSTVIGSLELMADGDIAVAEEVRASSKVYVRFPASRNGDTWS